MLKFILALLSSVFALVAWAYAATPRFDTHELKVDGQIKSVLSHDLDGDGRKDLLIVHTTLGKGGRVVKWFSVYWQGPKGFGEGRMQSWEVDSRAAAVDVGDLYGDLKGEIAFLAGDGVFIYHQNGGRFSTEPTLLLREASILSLAPEEDIPVWNFVADLDGDGRNDLVIPQVGRYALYLRDGNGYRRAGSPQVKMSFTVGSDGDGEEREDARQASQIPPIRVAYRGSGLNVSDFDGDGKKDLLAVWKDNLDVFPHKGGRFGDEPEVRMKMELLSPEERESDISQVSLRLEDMNGDGIVDIVGLKSRLRGPTDVQSQVQIFYGKRGGSYSALPDRIVMAEGIGDPILQDLDGNGVIDIIMPQMKFDLAALVRILTTRSIDIGLTIYLGDRLGEYPTKPTLVRNLSLGVKLFEGRRGAPLFRMDGDFNGDKRPDILVGTGDSEFLVFWGGPDGSPGAEVGLKLRLKKPDQLQTVDLDGDGSSDLIAVYQNEGKVSVLLSGR